MATINTGLGGPQGVGEGSFRGTTLNAANGGSGNYDDGSIRVDITSVFGPAGISFFGTNYTSIYINSNGLITFQAPVPSYTPTSISSLNYPAIAAFWSDVNITSGSATGTNNIYWDLDPASGRVTITWLGVKPYQNPNTSGTNTFQLVLEHTHDGNFEIDFIYQQIQWTNGYTGVAQTGLTNGGAIDYALPGSGNSAALLNYPNAVLDPNDPNGVWSTRFLNGNPVCFVAGTHVATPDGPRAVESLRAGDRVLTLDDGAQTLIWAGGGSVLASDAALPVTIGAGVLGNSRDLSVSPQHLLMISGPDCMMHFAEAEVLVAARDLTPLDGVTQGAMPGLVQYHHLLLERHHILFAEGQPTESLHPGPMALQDMSRAALASLHATVPPRKLARIAARPAARRILRAHEARMLACLRQREPA